MLDRFAVITLPKNEEDKKKCFEELEAVASKYEAYISKKFIIRGLDVEDAKEIMERYTVDEEDLVWIYLVREGKSIKDVIKEALDVEERYRTL